MRPAARSIASMTTVGWLGLCETAGCEERKQTVRMTAATAVVRVGNVHKLHLWWKDFNGNQTTPEGMGSPRPKLDDGLLTHPTASSCLSQAPAREGFSD